MSSELAVLDATIASVRALAETEQQLRKENRYACPYCFQRAAEMHLRWPRLEDFSYGADAICCPHHVVGTEQVRLLRWDEFSRFLLGFVPIVVHRAAEWPAREAVQYLLCLREYYSRQRGIWGEG